MASDELTVTFRFAHRLSPDEAAILARAMADLIKLQPASERNWQYSLECPPEQAYELGVATAKLVGELARVVAPTGNGSLRHPLGDGAGTATPAERAAPKANRHARKTSARALRDARPRKAHAKAVVHCPHCAMPFVRTGNLAKHIAKVHPDATPSLN